MREEGEVRAEMARVTALLHAARDRRHSPGRAEAMRDSDAVEASLAASAICALAFVLRESDSSTERSRRLR